MLSKPFRQLLALQRFVRLRVECGTMTAVEGEESLAPAFEVLNAFAVESDVPPDELTRAVGLARDAILERHPEFKQPLKDALLLRHGPRYL